MNIKTSLLIAAVLALESITTPSTADDIKTIPVTIENHIFTPAEIHVPAKTRVNLDVENKDNSTEEFDSDALQVEKTIGGGKKGIVKLQPLDPGKYPFVGEYHEDTAQGVVIAE